MFVSMVEGDRVCFMVSHFKRTTLFYSYYYLRLYIITYKNFKTPVLLACLSTLLREAVDSYTRKEQTKCLI